MATGKVGGGPAGVSIAVMAHPARASWAEDLAGRLGCDVVWDRINNVWDTARRAWLSYDRDASHHMVVQDDVLVCDGLVDVVGLVAADRPDGVVSLMVVDDKLSAADRRRYRQAVADGDRWFEAWRGLPGCALMMPTGAVDDVVRYGDLHQSRHDDVKIMSFWRRQRVPAGFVIPSLVQHRRQDVNPSLVTAGGKWRPRQSSMWRGEQFDARTVWSDVKEQTMAAVAEPHGPVRFVNRVTGRVVTVSGPKVDELDAHGRWVRTDDPFLNPAPVDDLDGMTAADLRERCRARGLPVYGSKAQLVERLRA